MPDKAKYIQVAEALKGSIIRGYFKEGDLLPSENELSAQYGFTRMTIRHALENLESEGFVHKQKGKGSIVKSKRKSFEILSLRGFTEVMKRKDGNMKIATQFLGPIQVRAWPSDFYWTLTEEDIKSGCIQMTRNRLLDNCPVILERTFLPNRCIGNFVQSPLVNDSLFDTLVVNYGIEMIRVEQKIRAVSADEELANALEIELKRPVLEVIRKLHTNKKDFHVYTYAYCNTEEFSLEI